MSKAIWIAENLKAGEQYAGIILGKDGAPDHHLILLPGQADGVTFSKAVEWAKAAGGELPSRREQSLLYANLKAAFEPRWYWSGEQYAANSSYAWGQHFGIGYQVDYRKVSEFKARAVRRLVIF